LSAVIIAAREVYSIKNEKRIRGDGGDLRINDFLRRSIKSLNLET
jgi:hypothetical protein